MIAGTRMTRIVEAMAIDVGYGYVKIAVDNGNDTPSQFSFPAIAPMRDADAFDIEDEVNAGKLFVVEHMGVQYLVGENAGNHAPVANFRNIDSTYSKSPQYWALMRGAFAAAGVTEVRHLVLGLPLTTLREMSGPLAENYKGVITVSPGYNVRVHNVSVVGQPLGAMLSPHNNVDIETYRNITSLIIDSGYQTLDWIVAKGPAVQTNRSGSDNTGMFHVLTSILSAISRETGVDVNTDLFRARLDDSLTDGKEFRIRGETYNMSRHYELIRQVLGKALGGLMAKIGSADDIDRVVVSGGGGKLFTKSLTQRFSGRPVVLLQNPRFAVVLGFLRIAKKMAANQGRTHA